jgi:small subunit ribosomal protein S17e
MGKAVPKRVKSLAKTLLEEYPEKFSSKDFVGNKKFIDSLNLPFSKNIRNLVAGFITRVKGNELKA